ncbi:MAG: NifB/NifX family molybdenum-iron cluster-binding protein [Candidatus Bipolaricaulota bacterium]
MNVCLPVVENLGLESLVNEHFGSTPAFLIVDTETGEYRAVVNENAHHAHGMCQPLAALRDESIHAIVAGGIGAGALRRLHAEGIDVYLAQPGTVAQMLAALKEGTLRKATPETACRGH